MSRPAREDAKRLILRIRRRLFARRALALLAVLGTVALGLAFVPLLASKWRVLPVEATTFAVFGVAGPAVVLALVLARLTRPTHGDAARALDDFHGTGELFLTAIDDAERASALSPAFERALATRLTAVDARRVVPLGALRGTQAFLILLVVDSVLALTSGHLPRADATVADVQAYLDLMRAPDADSPDPALAELIEAGTREELQRAADRIWRERLNDPPTPSSSTSPDQRRRRLLEAIRSGELRRGADLASQTTDDLDDPEFRAALARALRERAARDGGAAADALVSAEAAADAGDGAGLVASLSRAADVAAEPPGTVDARRLREVVLAVYARLGTAPPPDVNAGDDPAPAGGGAAGLDHLDLARYPVSDRPLLERYYARRATRGSLR